MKVSKVFGLNEIFSKSSHFPPPKNQSDHFNSTPLYNPIFGISKVYTEFLPGIGGESGEAF